MKSKAQILRGVKIYENLPYNHNRYKINYNQLRWNPKKSEAQILRGVKMYENLQYNHNRYKINYNQNILRLWIIKHNKLEILSLILLMKINQIVKEKRLLLMNLMKKILFSNIKNNKIRLSKWTKIKNNNLLSMIVSIHISNSNSKNYINIKDL